MSNRAKRVYILTSPSGEVVEILNMIKFCTGTDLLPSGMYQLANGNGNRLKSYKGWTIPTEAKEIAAHGALKGSAHLGAKLNERQVREIRQKFAAGQYLHRELGIEYGVSRRTIGRIIAREIWKHVAPRIVRSAR